MQIVAVIAGDEMVARPSGVFVGNDGQDVLAAFLSPSLEILLLDVSDEISKTALTAASAGNGGDMVAAGYAIFTEKKIFIFVEIFEEVADGFVFIAPGGRGLEYGPDSGRQSKGDIIGDRTPGNPVTEMTADVLEVGEVNGEFFMTFELDAFGIAGR